MIWGLASLTQRQLRAAEDEGERAYEVVIGVVVDIKDPARLCRVRVRIPALGPDATWWCPVVATGAGRDRGWFTVPEVDDEVLVGFEHGEVGRPIVIGRIWNGSDAPPDTNGSGDNPRRVIASKSGHTITFDDKEGKLIIADGGGIGVITIAKDAGVTIEAKQGSVAMQAKDELVIVAGEIAITGKAAVDLMGKSSGVDGTGKAAVKITGNLVALKGATIDVNPGGVAAAAKADATVDEVPDCAPAASEGGGSEAAGGSAAAGGPATGGASTGDDNTLLRLTRQGTERITGGYVVGPAGAAAAGLLADKDDTAKPLVTAVVWADGEARWGTRRAWTVTDAATDPAAGALTVEATCENLGNVTVKIRAADGGAVLATASAAVSGGKVSWRFEPKVHGLTACQDVVAEVSGGGSTATSKAVAHVHQPYWQSPDSSLAYELAWPPREEKSPKEAKESTHYVDDIIRVTLDEAGKANLAAWGGKLTLYMKAHLGVNIPAITQTAPRCRFDVRDLQADLGALGLWFDSERSLTGAGFSTKDEPSGAFGPMTFLGITVLDRLSMRDTNSQQVPSGAYRAGQPTNLTGAEKQKFVAPGKSYTPPMKVDARIAKVLRAWRIGQLTPRLDGEEFEQVAIKWHGGGTFKVQRRQARKILTWLYAIEGAGGFLQNAGPRRPWDWPLWRRYANKRVPASTHYCGLAVDFPTDTGATTPMDPYVVVYEGNSRFKTYANRAVARRAASRGYPDQSAVAQTLGIPHAAVRQNAQLNATKEAKLDASLNKALLAGYLEGRRSDLVKHAKEVERKHAQAVKAAEAAGRKLFGADGNVDTDADRALVADLMRGAATPSQMKDMVTLSEQSGLALVLAARGRAYTATLDGLKTFAAFVAVAPDQAKTAQAVAAYAASVGALDTKIDALVAKLQTAAGGQAAVTAAKASAWVRAQGDQPWAFNPTEPTPPPAASQLTADARADLVELLLLLGERAVRAAILAPLQTVKAAADVIVMPVVGDFVRIDDLVSGGDQLHRIGRNSEWEWWHFQFPDPAHPELDIQIIEMARELGIGRIVSMVHRTESYKAELAEPQAKKAATLVKKQYAWWAGLHPNEVDGDTYASGTNLAELLLPVR